MHYDTKLHFERIILEISDDEEFSPISPEGKRRNVANNVLTEKSKKVYEKLYKQFMDWRNAKNISSFTENDLLAYFHELQQKMKPSSLWTHCSVIKSVLNVRHNVDISGYRKLYALLKQKSAGYIAKKSKTFSPDQIKRFLDEAPDFNFLCSKVSSISIN